MGDKFFMGIKLVVTDLDGTLLNSEQKVSTENKEAVRAAVDSGVVVTIATGRMYSSALPYAKQLAIDVPIITYNGAVIQSVNGKVIFERFVEPTLVKAVAAFCRERNWYVQIYSDDNLYFAEHNDKAKSYEELAGIKGIAVGDKLYDLDSRVPKMLVMTDTAEETDGYIEMLQSKFEGKLFVVKSNPTYIEIVSPAVNKAAALTILREKLQIDKADVMAIGDSGNDIPMLKEAGKSVAMRNAVKSIQQLCDYVTDDCDHSGVAKAINKFVLKN